MLVAVSSSPQVCRLPQLPQLLQQLLLCWLLLLVLVGVWQQQAAPHRKRITTWAGTAAHTHISNIPHRQ
jgi:hypothetical protein